MLSRWAVGVCAFVGGLYAQTPTGYVFALDHVDTSVSPGQSGTIRPSVVTVGNAFTLTVNYTHPLGSGNYKYTLNLLTPNISSIGLGINLLLLTPRAMFEGAITAVGTGDARVIGVQIETAGPAGTRGDCGLSFRTDSTLTFPYQLYGLGLQVIAGKRFAVVTTQVSFGYSSMSVKAYYTYEAPPPPQDGIAFRKALPENGTRLEAGLPPPVFAQVDYQLGTKDEGEIFLELTTKDGILLGTSDSRRVRKGAGSVGSGDGKDEVLRVDGLDIPDRPGESIELRAWLAETQGRGRLRSSSPIAYAIWPPTKLNLQLAELNGDPGNRDSYRPIDPSRDILRGHRPEKKYFLVTSENGGGEELLRQAKLQVFAKSNR